MSGRTMVRCSVGMNYFPFFLAAAFLAAGFFAAAFLAAGLAAFFAAVFAAALAGAFFAAFFTAGVARTGVFVLRDGRSTRASANGSIAFPMAPDSMSTRSDHRMW